MSNRHAMILGATSEMATALAYEMAKRQIDLTLVARDVPSLERVRADLSLRYNVTVSLETLDIMDAGQRHQFLARKGLSPDIVACFVGTLGDEMKARGDERALTDILHANFEGPAIVLSALANAMVANGGGVIVGVSSVAGERGRQSNYVYGAAKAGFTAFLSGLRNRLVGEKVHVVTILPGFVDTKMTRHLALPKVLTATPQEVALSIMAAINKRRNIVYVKPVWRVIMFCVKATPEFIFKKLKM
jgi:short-subunit dehydrogenase